MSALLNSIHDDTKRDHLLDILPKAFTQLEPLEQEISLGLYNELAKGHPVDCQQLASQLNISLEEVNRVIDSWTAVYYNDQQQIVGYWGLAIGEMPHRMEIDNRTLYTWCAWDSLFIPPLLGKTAKVHSKCAATEQAIELTVTPSGIVNLQPETTVMSYIDTKGEKIEDDIINQFCHYILFFQSADAGAQWIKQQPDTFLMSVEDGFKLAQRKNQRQYPQLFL